MEILISQFVAYISGTIANLLTEVFKTNKNQLELTPAEEVKREQRLKVLNAFLSLGSVVGISYLSNEALDIEVTTGFITVIVTSFSAWLFSQANYHLAKRAQINSEKKSLSPENFSKTYK